MCVLIYYFLYFLKCLSEYKKVLKIKLKVSSAQFKIIRMTWELDDLRDILWEFIPVISSRTCIVFGMDEKKERKRDKKQSYTQFTESFLYKITNYTKSCFFF